MIRVFYVFVTLFFLGPPAFADHCPALLAEYQGIANPGDIATDGAVVFVSTPTEIVEIDASGNTTSFGHGTLSYPGGLVADGQHVFVADFGNNCVREYDYAGNLISTFGSLGSGSGQYDRPRAVAADTSFLYVADEGNHRVDKLDFQGNTVVSWTCPLDPIAIAVGGSRVYTLGMDSIVDVFDTDGNTLSEWSVPGGDNLSCNVHSIGTDGSVIYIGDWQHNRVEKLDVSGKLLSFWTYDGMHSFSDPSGVVPLGDSILVADYLNNRVDKFTSCPDIVLTRAGGLAASGVPGDLFQYNADVGYFSPSVCLGITPTVSLSGTGAALVYPVPLDLCASQPLNDAEIFRGYLQAGSGPGPWSLSLVLSLSGTAPDGTVYASVTMAAGTVTIYATPSPAPTATASPTTVPLFASSGSSKLFAGPVPASAGEDVCLYFPSQPRSTRWTIFNMAGEEVADLVFHGEARQCWKTASIAAGLYIAKIHFEDMQGGGREVWQKIAIR